MSKQPKDDFGNRMKEYYENTRKEAENHIKSMK